MITEPLTQESFRDRIATVDERGKRKWIYAVKPSGKFYKLRSVLSYFYFIAFFAIPFIQVNGRPLLMFNVTEPKFIIFSKVFWPQDFIIFGITMITFIFFIVLFTAAFGRLFCGWACPQTNFMEMMFRKVEYFIVGSANEQKRLKASAWTGEKIRKTITKHLVFYLLSFVIANFFLAYIIGMKELRQIIADPLSKHLVGFTAIIIFSAVFYAVYAFFREQACTVVCPYGRLQSVLLDRNSMIVAYDYKRGEPRGNAKKKSDEQLGDCIDCYQCVTVCPTGIDIRNGLQLECVGCTACIDACNSVMKKIHKPTGLIRYASENLISSGDRLHYTTRMKVYTGLCLLAFGALVSILATRKDIGATVMRTPGLLYQERGSDSISNLYNIKMTNKTEKPLAVTVKLENEAGTVEIIGKTAIAVVQEGQGSGSFFIVLPKKSIHGRKTELKLGIYQGATKIASARTNFLSPVE